MPTKLTFVDLFAGIGGFHYAFHELGAECVFASEIDKYARKTYEHNFKTIASKLFQSGHFNNDIFNIEYNKINNFIPDFDILCAGFPCQPFSQLGRKLGFLEDRGNIFFKIRDIIEVKKPKVIFLENVPYLLKHDKGKTFKAIKNILEKELKYELHYKVVKASDFGLPQNRPRLFIICFRKDDYYSQPFIHPDILPLKLTMSDVFNGKCNKSIGYTLRVGGRGSGLNNRHNWDTYLVNDKEVRLTPKEGLLMQGFPNGFEFPVSETQAMKQLGNSIAINAVKAYGSTIINVLESRCCYAQ